MVEKSCYVFETIMLSSERLFAIRRIVKVFDQVYSNEKDVVQGRRGFSRSNLPGTSSSASAPTCSCIVAGWPSPDCPWSPLRRPPSLPKLRSVDMPICDMIVGNMSCRATAKQRGNERDANITDALTLRVRLTTDSERVRAEWGLDFRIGKVNHFTVIFEHVDLGETKRIEPSGFD